MAGNYLHNEVTSRRTAKRAIRDARHPASILSFIWKKENVLLAAHAQGPAKQVQMKFGSIPMEDRQNVPTLLPPSHPPQCCVCFARAFHVVHVEILTLKRSHHVAILHIPSWEEEALFTGRSPS